MGDTVQINQRQKELWIILKQVRDQEKESLKNYDLCLQINNEIVAAFK